MPRSIWPGRYPPGCRPRPFPGATLAAQVAGTLLLLVTACSGGPQDEADPPAALGVVDSTHPIEEEIRRFVSTVDSLPAALRDGAASRESLVRRFLRAVESRDTVELARLVLQRDEFIALYYPHTRFTAPPYELAPGLLWFQMQNVSSRGLGRLLARNGGQSLQLEGLACEAAPVVEERNRLWTGCAVRVRDSAGMTRSRRLFGTILERDGTWKFLGYGNEY